MWLRLLMTHLAAGPLRADHRVGEARRNGAVQWNRRIVDYPAGYLFCGLRGIAIRSAKCVGRRRIVVPYADLLSLGQRVPRARLPVAMDSRVAKGCRTAV